MSGRGRGINNNPAWMNQQQQQQQQGGGGGGGGAMSSSHVPPDDFGRRPHAPPNTHFHRGGGPPPDSYRGPPRGSRIAPPGRYDRPRYDDRYDDRGPPPRGGGGGGGDRYDDRGPPRGGGGGGGGYRARDRGPPPPRRGRPNQGGITFRSMEEEREWVEERRRKRMARPSKFDKPPTAQQTAALADAAAAALTSATLTAIPNLAAAQPQQTRHARRLYIGNLPPATTEEEIHNFFRHSIGQALVGPALQEDPVLSVYINHERHFAFLEFKVAEMATACMALDGLDLNNRGKLKIKRPNDYNPAQAPMPNPAVTPVLDVSRLGIINGTVDDGSNKIFIGGLHYHLQEQQVLELLHAFGKVKAFHLVKQSPDSDSSKGYCFVEYADPAVTPVAVAGLTGMDIGSGKNLTARLAGGQAVASSVPVVAAIPPPPPAHGAAPPQDRTIVSGYDIEVLVDAALGQRPMPTAPQYMDGYGMPLTVVTNSVLSGASPVAALTNSVSPPPVPRNLPPTRTRILVLLNMVAEEDLSTADDHEALVDEVREECAKFGQLVNIKVPRVADGADVEASAVRKIFLEYASVADAAKAEQELNGRQFGESTVETSYYSEADFAAGRLR